MEDNKKTEDKKGRVNYTTTYDPIVLEKFKEVSKEINVASGIILEAFMKGFVNKEFILTWDMINGYTIKTNENNDN